MTPSKEGCTYSAWTTAGVEDPCIGGYQCIYQPCLAIQVGAFRRHFAEPLDVPLGVAFWVVCKPEREGGCFWLISHLFRLVVGSKLFF